MHRSLVLRGAGPVALVLAAPLAASLSIVALALLRPRRAATR